MAKKKTAKKTAKKISTKTPNVAKKTIEKTTAKTPKAAKKNEVKQKAIAKPKPKPTAKAVVKPIATDVVKTSKKSKPDESTKSVRTVVPAQGTLLNKLCPSFALKNSENKEVTLESLKGKKVVLYFYPKDSTPGCTLEGQEFSRLHKDFQKENTVILGVSKDSVSSHEKFKCKYNFPFDLLADEDGKLCDAFDVIREKNMYGKKYMGIERSTFILDENQKIIGEFRKISLAGHAKFILDQIKFKA